MSDPTPSPAPIALPLADGRGATLNLRPDATVLAVGDETVSSFDLEGRPYVLVRDGGSYRRACDGRWLEKRAAEPGRPRLRRRLDAEQGAPVADAARREAEAVLGALAAASLPQALAEEAASRLRRIAACDAGALAADAGRYARVYSPVGILPPDQYLALVVQVTEGCSWNACSFCDLYRGTRFRVKSEAELRVHLAEVRGYFGAALALRRSLFLGDANALCVGHERLLPLLEAVVAELPELARRGVHAFVDVVSGRRKPAREYREYARLGLRRVYVGLESGDPELLRWLDKPGEPEDAVGLVAALHEAGLDAGVIVLVGAGGERFAEAHARLTAATLSRMRLGPRDLVYFSEIVEHPTLDYARRAGAEALVPLGIEALAAQRRAIAGGLRAADPARPPRLSSYDIREFVY